MSLVAGGCHDQRMGKRRARDGFRGAPDPEPYEGPPTVIDVQVDYACSSMLVDRSPGIAGVRGVPPEELGLSPGLVARLSEWVARSEPWASVGVTTHVDEAEPDWVAGEGEWLRHERVTLAYAVQHELGPDVEVLLDGAPVSDRRGP